MTAEPEGKAAAERFRRDYRLGTQPIGDLVAIIEQTVAVDVAVLDAEPDEHGLTMRDPDRDAVFIAVARTTRPMRQRSTLAHELGHVTFADWKAAGDGWSNRSPEEIRADAFARHLLIPLAGLREFLADRKPIEQTDLSDVVQRFLVSPSIAAIALHQAKYIDGARKEEWKALTTPTLAARFGWSDQYRALRTESCQRRAPQRLLTRAITGYREGVVSVQTIATLRGADATSIEHELATAGIQPTDPAVTWADPAELPDVSLDLSDLDDEPPEGTPR